MSAAPPCAYELLDVLEQLPRTELRKSLWKHVAPAKDDGTLGKDTPLGTHAFRLSCRRARALADQLISSVCVRSDMEPDDAQFDITGAATLISRVETLQVLSLECMGGESAFMDTLHRVGRPLQHVTTLILTAHHGTFSWAAGAAVRQGCPNVARLDLAVLGLHASCFVPFHDWYSLSTVCITQHYDSNRLDGRGILQELAHLPSLTALMLPGAVDAAHLTLLTNLRSIKELLLSALHVRAAAADGSLLGRALGALTRLSSLYLPHWVTDPPEDACIVINDVLAQLSSLQSLAQLNIWSDDEGLVRIGVGSHALCQLSMLTFMMCPAWDQRCWASSGNLPNLESVFLRSWMSARELVATLRPLRPLSNLQRIRCRVLLTASDGTPFAEDSDEEVDIAQVVQPAADNARRMAMCAWKAARLLAAAPLRDGIHLILNAGAPVQAPLSSVAINLLAPLHGSLTMLHIMRMSAATMAEVLPSLCNVTRLQSLNSYRCHWSRTAVLQVAQSLTALSWLGLTRVRGVSGSSAVALAGVRLQPLSVYWTPHVTEEQRAAFEEAAREGVVLMPPDDGN